MVDIFGSSKALSFVSLFEGFWLPIIEAMKCNVPVITSNTSAMPEIAGDAALIVNPNDVNEISDAMSQIDNDSKLSKKLILKGQKKIHKFKWDITANVIHQVLLKYAN